MIARAHARAALSYDLLRPLTEFARPESDRAWAARAPGLSPAALYREADRHGRVSAGQAADLHEARSFRMSWDEERPLL